MTASTPGAGSPDPSSSSSASVPSPGPESAATEAAVAPKTDAPRPDRRFPRIARRAQGLLVLTALAPALLAITAWQIGADRAMHLDRARTAMTTTVRHQALGIQHLIKSGEGVLLSLRQTPPLSPAPPRLSAPEARALEARLATAFGDLPALSSIVGHDPHGDAVFAARRITSKGASDPIRLSQAIPLRPSGYLQAAGTAPILVDARPTTGTLRLLLPLASDRRSPEADAPVSLAPGPRGAIPEEAESPPQGRRVDVLTAQLNMRTVLASALPAGSCGMVMLTGRMVAHMGLCSPDRLETLRQIGREADPSAIRVAGDSLVAARRLTTAPITLVFDRPLVDVLADWRRETWRKGSLIGALLALLAAFGATLAVQARRTEAAEAALLRRERQISAALRGSGLGFWDYDPATDAFTLNEGPLAKGGDLSVWTRVPDADRDSLRTALNTHQTPNAPPLDLICRMDLGQGHLSWVRLRGRSMAAVDPGRGMAATDPGRGGGKAPARMTGLWADVTDQATVDNDRRRLAAAVDNSPIAVFVSDAEGRIDYANARAEALFGYSPADLVGTRFDRLAATSTPASVLGAMARAVDAGASWQGEIQCTHKDGRLRWHKVAIAPILTDSGTVRDIVSIHEDITERRRLEQHLAYHASTVSAVLEAAPSGILVTDAEGRCRLTNQRLSRIWGLRRHDMDGAEPWALFRVMSRLCNDPKGFLDGTRDLAAFPTAVQKGQDILLRDGRTVMCGSVPVEQSADQRGGRVWFYTEVTEQKRVEQALSDQLEFQNTLINTLPSPLFYTDREGRFLGCNRAFADFLGVSMDAVFGVTAQDLLPPSLALDLAGDDSVLLSQGGLRFFEMTMADARGVPHTLSVAKAAFADAQGRINGLVGILTDISDLNGVAEELRRSNQELEQFAYVASHDLQEPLRMVSSYLGLLKRRYRGQMGEDADEFIRYAIDGAHRMQAMIHDLLQFSRIDTRGSPLLPVRIASCLNVAIDNLKVAIDEAGARLIVSDLPTVMADEAQIVSLFQNLLSNAVKYRAPERPPEIRITAQPSANGEMWEFAIADNGIGIDPRFADKVFLIFQRLQTRDHYEGTGIGLALCKKIVERHGGKIWLEGLEGQGTTFHFTLRGAGSGAPLPTP